MIARQISKGKKFMFAVGQRWLSETETELGLGIIVETQSRFVTVTFPASGEERRYTTDNSPLTRIIFSVGDTVTCSQGWTLEVENITVNEGVVSYHGIRSDTQDSVELTEVLLEHTYTLNQPKQRLLAGQYDGPQLFDVRHQCLQQQFNHYTSPLLGFVGARADLIPHQLHIASEVGQRFAPRVLLADEVGLGKTIEAALIAHQQIQSGRASRVLIIVPPSLVHQWLVEMLRRVNLAFSIFDNERYLSTVDDGNPFESEQLVICSLDFISQSARAHQDLCDAGWDLLIVDEAHHLQWSAEAPSQQYQVIEALANTVPGVLLLTATPDQLGHESHFARLRLLDADRFHNYSDFLDEEQQYSAIASVIDPLQLGSELTEQQQQALVTMLGQQAVTDALTHNSIESRQQLISQLLDRHGTGRVLFRNSRKSVSGFKARHLQEHPLELPEEYKGLLETSEDIDSRLHPESSLPHWFSIDPRVAWLITTLKALKGSKVLVICASAKTAIELSEAIRVKSGIRTTVFHEGMSIIERDQAASYFAQDDYGAQALICSEIGSEGRNFQFSHHLVLFDLPLNPDLLEQRIGRLDRIGQQQDISIHVPYFNDSPQALLKSWYHRGLNSFEQTCPTGRHVYQQVKQSLLRGLAGQLSDSECEQLLAHTSEHHQQATAQMEQGRDKLLELNSSGNGKVDSLLDAIVASDQANHCQQFMAELLDGIGVIQEDNDENSYILRPTERMQGTLPGLDEEGMTVTYDRATALCQENMHYLNWDHPLVHHAMDTVLTDNNGKSSLALSNELSNPAGTYWLEFVFVLRAQTTKHIPLQRYFPATPIHFVLDSTQTPVKRSFSGLKRVKKQMGSNVIKALHKAIEQGCGRAEQLIQSQVEGIKQKHLDKMQQQLDSELTRLIQLQQVNPSIRENEIDYLKTLRDDLTDAISMASVSMEAVRMIVNTH